MTIEQIEIRKILTQMLADNGINKDTIKDIVREIITEKVEQAIKKLENQTYGSFDSIEEKVDRAIDKMVVKELQTYGWQAVKDQVRGYFNNITVKIELGDKK